MFFVFVFSMMKIRNIINVPVVPWSTQCGPWTHICAAGTLEGVLITGVRAVRGSPSGLAVELGGDPNFLSPGGPPADSWGSSQWHPPTGSVA